MREAVDEGREQLSGDGSPTRFGERGDQVADDAGNTASESSISILQPKVWAPALSGAGGTGFHPLVPKASLCVLTHI